MNAFLGYPPQCQSSELTTGPCIHAKSAWPNPFTRLASFEHYNWKVLHCVLSLQVLAIMLCHAPAPWCLGTLSMPEAQHIALITPMHLISTNPVASKTLTLVCSKANLFVEKIKDLENKRLFINTLHCTSTLYKSACTLTHKP